MVVVNSAALSNYGQADETPSRAVWFMFGVGAAMLWPIFSAAIGLGQRRIVRLSGRR